MISSSGSALAELISEAQSPREVLEPSSVLEALRSFNNARGCLFNHAQSEELFHALIGTHGHLPRPSNSQPLDAAARNTWAALVRWLMNAIRTWQPEGDPQFRVFVAILIVSQALDVDGTLWDMMPAGGLPSPAFIAQSQALLRTCSISFAIRPGHAVEPISEREIVDQFQIDDTEGRWGKIGDAIRLFEGSLYFVSLGLTQLVCCLYSHGIEYLVDAVSSVRQTLVAVQIASVLSSEKALRLAAASANAYVQFGCVYHVVSRQPQSASLTSGEQEILSDVLVKVAQDETRWAAWMVAFNTYPVRRPMMQEPLGVALASVSRASLSAYVDVISLTVQTAGQNVGRVEVARCLRAFAAAAPLPQRQALWQLGHERWLAWNLGQGGQQNRMFAISWSELDYAVAGYAAECLDAQELLQRMDDLRAEIQVFDRAWFESKSDFTTAWFRLLSKFQPYAHVSKLAPGNEDWLAERHTYMPFDPADNEYIFMKFVI